MIKSKRKVERRLSKKDNDIEKGKSRGEKKDDIKRKSLENGCC